MRDIDKYIINNTTNETLRQLNIAKAYWYGIMNRLIKEGKSYYDVQEEIYKINMQVCEIHKYLVPKELVYGFGERLIKQVT